MPDPSGAGGRAAAQFSVLFEKRAHNTLDRMETINMVAQLVPKPHTVDLTAPDKTILVSLIKVWAWGRAQPRLPGVTTPTAPLMV
jgi:hypothetical protein